MNSRQVLEMLSLPRLFASTDASLGFVHIMKTNFRLYVSYLAEVNIEYHIKNFRFWCFAFEKSQYEKCLTHVHTNYYRT